MKKNILLIISSIFISLFAIELILRLVDHQPFIYRDTNSPHPTIYKNDNITGWSNKKGIYQVKIDNYNTVVYKILDDGSRYSGNDLSNNKNKIILIGGSFTLGQALNDTDTFAYRLQKILKKFDVKNFGSGGFGTYQSYLKLRELYEKFDNISYVLYFFVDHHEVRNIGDASWMEYLSKLASQPVKLPYVKLDNSLNLIEYAPLEYLTLPLSNHIVLISKIQKKIMRYILYSKKNEQVIATQKIILKINKLVKMNGGKFVMINLLSEENKKLDYENFTQKNNIPFIDCEVKLDSNHIVKNEGHPNELANKKYYECVKKIF